ncbi:MAG: dicarboxylate/amino acid:cation symporter [Crocinitomicaceae bacterium]|nr:dicarboxylate/amino acid:cation symporter [Crocinitomicaceae bacterium]
MKRKIPIHWQIIIGLLLGVLWAICSSFLGWSDFTLNWIDPFGKIFIKLLKMIAVPIVLFSLIKGVSELADISKLGKLGFKTLGIYILTTVIAVSIGLSLVNIFKPGDTISNDQKIVNRIQYEIWCEESGNKIKDGKHFLSNPAYKSEVDSAKVNFNKQKEDFSNDESLLKRKENVGKQKDARPLQFLVDIVPSNIFQSLTDLKSMLQIIFFAAFFGAVLLLISKEKAQPVNALIDGLNDVFLKMVDLIMKAAPFFVFALLAGKLSELAKDDPSKLFDTFYSLGAYCLVVLGGLFLMAFVFYPLLVLFFTGKNIGYAGFFKRISPAQFLAFSTSSSAATLPITIECVRDRIGVSKEITSFVLPIGATVNMDGTSLYQAVAAIFLAQYFGVDLELSQQLTIIITATLASIGSAAVPGAGVVMLMIVLESVGLNAEWVALILPVDRILDMCRTVVNVTGDATVATVIASSERKLEVIPDEKMQTY